MNKNLNDYIEDFLQYLQTQGKRSATARNYRLYLKRFTDFVGNISASEIIPQKIIGFQNYIGGNGLSKITASYHSVAIRSFLIYLAKMQIRSLSPEAVDIPKVQRKEAQVLTQEELEAILQAANPNKKGELRDRTILEVLAATGCRVNELVNIKVDDLDIQEKTIVIREGKGGKTRVVFLTQNALHYLKRYLKKHKSDYLFYSKNANNITSRSIQRLVKKYALKAGIKKNIYPHIFRHTLGTLLLQKGADLRSVQGILGHSSIMTTQLYTHLTDKGLQKVYDQAQSSFSTTPNGNPVKNEFVIISKENWYSIFGKLNRIMQVQNDILQRVKALENE